MPKFYVESRDFKTIIDRPDVHKAVLDAFLRIRKIAENFAEKMMSCDTGFQETPSPPKMPSLAQNIYVGERGFVMREDGTLRHGDDISIIPTQEVLVATKLTDFYKFNDEKITPPLDGPPPKQDQGPFDGDYDGLGHFN